MRFVLAVIAAIAAVQPAAAGWRWTDWGSTIAEVQAAYAGDPAGEGAVPVTADALAAKNFVIVPAEGLSVAVRMNYSEGRLSSVAEQPLDAESCPAFIAYVEAAFAQTGLAGARTKWVDAASESSITLDADEPGSCSARFSRAPRQ